MAMLMENKLMLIFGVLGLYMIVLIIFMIRKKKKDKQFELETPRIAKVHLETGISIRSDKKLRIFSEGIHTGYYFEPGEHTINVSYYYEKMTKRVTIMESPITIMVEAATEYDLSYDVKSNEYIFSERENSKNNR